MSAPLGLADLGRTSSLHRRCNAQTTVSRASIQPRAALVARAAQQQQEATDAPSTSRRQLLAGLSTTIGLSLLSPLSTKAEPFLQSTGARGLLAEEEEKLYRLRQEKEGEARRALEEQKTKLEEESRQQQGNKLCATPFGVDVVGITELVALVGALVGGITARQRKAEVERLNEQLRKINLSLRQQARAGTVYAPGLTYVPPLTKVSNGNGNGHGSELEPSTAAAASATATLPKPMTLPAPAMASELPSAAATATAAASGATALSMLSLEEEDISEDQRQCRDALKQGKRLLKEQNGAAAMVRFEKALMLSKALQERVLERRAMRGLAAAARLQGQYKAAIRHLERVLDISREMQEYTGDADAYGTIADNYTDMGDFDKAAMYYDKYIQAMNKDGPV